MAVSEVFTGVVIRVPCGQSFLTTVNGVPVNVICDPGTPSKPPDPQQSWKLPDPPPSSSGGTVAYIQAAASEPVERLDLSALVEAARTGEIESIVTQAGESTSPYLFEAPSGDRFALDEFTDRLDG